MLTGKTVVVTGGSRGIGHGLVQRLLEQARHNLVVATARQPSAAAGLQELARTHGDRLLVTQLDVSSPASITSWATDLRQRVSHVDVLINNAGVYGRRLGLPELTAEDFSFAFNTNAVGPFLVVQALLANGLLGHAPPEQQQQPAQGGSGAAAQPAGGGSEPEAAAAAGAGQQSLVVNVTSIMASHGDPTISGVTPGGYAYRASKAALNIITHALSLDLRERGVDCVLLHPGYVRTDMTGGTGYVTVDESADGIMQVLTGKDRHELAGRWWAFNGDEVPW